ncbi:MAG TPA: ABC transporter ATP-binding protein, partial [Anaerolineaceae bacterium]|nr:ABC transporter ATP-binding protein [Anaerolineaceae bacterium]
LRILRTRGIRLRCFRAGNDGSRCFRGRVIMDGQTDTVWVWAWALLLISIIPFQLATTWMQNRFSESLGVIFKQRLMYGALKMNPDDIRHLGAGQLLERVMDAESVETLVLSGGLSALISVFQLGIAAWVLAQGPGGGFSVAVLGLWVAAILVAGWINFRSGKRWTNAYRGMTNHMVEKMVGHRTRLAQEDPAHHHDDEDVELDEYQALSLNFSRTGMLLSAIPSSWVVAGLACLIPALTSSQAYRLPNMAIGLGGVMLAYQAFGVIQAGIQNTIMLLLSWEQAKPIFHAAADPETPAPIVPGAEAAQPNTPGTQDPQIPLIAVHDLSYRFAPNRPAALQNCRLEIYPGDRLILEGPSGSGKTTLGAVLAGLRQPDAGLLLLQGYDRFCLGEGAWRKRVVMAPQFHENHIFNETFAFNLLMGRRWPPQPQDLQDAAAICQELGLGDLLARMPSGWQQMVGENGWQLSHGERSRVFIARALLQNADLVIMDESFGALDPENLYLALDCARRRAATLLIIAHP